MESNIINQINEVQSWFLVRDYNTMITSCINCMKSDSVALYICEILDDIKNDILSGNIVSLIKNTSLVEYLFISKIKYTSFYEFGVILEGLISELKMDYNFDTVKIDVDSKLYYDSIDVDIPNLSDDKNILSKAVKLFKVYKKLDGGNNEWTANVWYKVFRNYTFYCGFIFYVNVNIILKWRLKWNL